MVFSDSFRGTLRAAMCNLIATKLFGLVTVNFGTENVSMVLGLSTVLSACVENASCL
jgi:hypothetical protein